MHIKKILFLFAILLLFHCSNNKVQKTNTVLENKKNYAYIAIYKNNILVFNNNFTDTISLFIPDTLKEYSLSNSIFLKSDSNLYEFNMNSFSFIFRGKFNASFDNIYFIKNARIMLFDSSLVIKHEYKQYNLLEKTLLLKQFWINPYHSFVYVLDSLGYFYSIDYQNRLLKKKIFIGKINKLKFYKYGTRIYILSENSFIILDYETLNIIYEIKENINDFAFSPSLNALYLLDNTKKNISIINTFDYKNEKRVDFLYKINSFNAQDSVLIILSHDYSTVLSYINNNKYKEKKLKTKCDSILFIKNKLLFFTNKDSLIIYDIFNDSLKNFLSTKNLLYFNAFEIIDSFPKEIKTQKYHVKSIASKEKEIISNTFYSIQLASFKNIEQARKALKEHKKLIKNKRIFIIKANINDNIYYRIMAGQFFSRKEAAILKDYLLKIGYSKDIYIIPVYKKDIIK